MDTKKETTEFRRGIRAFYDYLTYRAANNYNGKPDIQKICDIENKIICDWAEDALEEISPDDYRDWKKIVT